MNPTLGKRLRALATQTALLVMAAAAGLATATTSRADESDAKRLLKGMSDYVAGQESISFAYNSSLELVTKQDQKVAFASSGDVTLRRPDKLRATRTGGFADVEMVFDGKTASLLGKDARVYTRVEIPGSIDNLVDVLRDKYHVPLPAADLLLSSPYEQIMPLVTDIKDLGSGVIRGQECDHLAFRTKEVDFQIWIHQGDHPYPCRYQITTTQVKGWPEYTIDVRSWKTGSDVPADDFTFKPSVDFKMLKLAEMPSLDALPSEVVKGIAK